ncbi:MAG TPA: carboxypeptidase-like regulatory domain-containing protein [Gammaproteobacteria bacterium]|nr:carboxypeptidase-like regulatory domain-containing protein [Luteimonas sp.]HRO26374.1 carboxypeptidase-like regulatory domain-containing protein [Luteimonas sp.]HRP35365.1 carboxypeptidase-like regulatory domain-containing protein [Gammaproteobacteria bacterium]HRP72714.1 carboxypeptidase-like regulatory domain-containing protein [Luteimonas sp.]
MLLLAAFVLSGTASCRDAGGTAAAIDGYVTGTVIDTQGKPIAGAKILLDGTILRDSYLRGTTGEDGSYRIQAQPGAWMAYAEFEKTYNGRSYPLALHPDSTDSIGDGGGVRNFRWKLEGRSPLNEYVYYGGFLIVDTTTTFADDIADVELTLTPDGPLIDGSEGKALRLRMHDHYWVQYGYIEDVPIGRYKVTAVLDNGGGPRPLKIATRNGDGVPATEYQLDFLPRSRERSRNSAEIIIGD